MTRPVDRQLGKTMSGCFLFMMPQIVVHTYYKVNHLKQSHVPLPLISPWAMMIEMLLGLVTAGRAQYSGLVIQ
jgi:hypothetical protein